MPNDRFVNRKEGDFHVIDWGGNGPLAHLSHATGFCAGLYTPFVQRLTGRLSVIGMDDRGHGRTRAVTNPNRLTNWQIFADDLGALFERMDEPVVAMGHSRGGVASLILAVNRPELVRALILIDPTILPHSWKWPWAVAKKIGLSRRIPIAARAAKRKAVWPDRETIRNAYSGKRMFRDWKDGFLDAYIQECTQKVGNGRIKLCCDPEWESRCFAACPHDVWRLLPKLDRPTLVLYGVNSPDFKASAVQRLKKELPWAEFMGFKDTGHFVPMERPDETAETIFDFLERNGVL